MTEQPWDSLAELIGADEAQTPHGDFAERLKQRLQEEAMTTSALETPEVMELFYFTLPAPDLGQSSRFFGSLFGWEVSGGSLGGNVSNTTPACGLSPGADPTERGLWLGTIDLDAAVDRVRALGGTVEQIDEYQTGRSATCRDDQGTWFNLQEPSPDYATYASDAAAGSRHGELFYFSLPVADGQRGRTFYSGLCGWTFGDEGEQGGLNAQNVSIEGGIGAGRDGQRVELWFRVDDIAATIEEVQRLGGTASEAFDTPQGLIAQCTDDQGVEFGLAQAAPGY